LVNIRWLLNHEEIPNIDYAQKKSKELTLLKTKMKIKEKKAQ